MPEKPDIKKEELPLITEEEITRAVSAFEACTLPYKNWTHRAHLAVAITYLQHLTLDDALAKIRSNINNYNQRCGDPAGYSETITILFLKKICYDKDQGRAFNNKPAEIERLASECSVEWLYQYYSKALIWSDSAKISWVEPDIMPLNF